MHPSLSVISHNRVQHLVGSRKILSDGMVENSELVYRCAFVQPIIKYHCYLYIC